MYFSWPRESEDSISLCLGVTHSKRDPCMCRQIEREMIRFIVTSSVDRGEHTYDPAVVFSMGTFSTGWWETGNSQPSGSRRSSGWAQTLGSTQLKPSPGRRFCTRSLEASLHTCSRLYVTSDDRTEGCGENVSISQRKKLRQSCWPDFSQTFYLLLIETFQLIQNLI